MKAITYRLYHAPTVRAELTVLRIFDDVPVRWNDLKITIMRDLIK